MTKLEAIIYKFLSEKYVQHQDARQKEMGLQYTTAETHDLAKEFARFLGQRGGIARANNLSSERRSEIARHAANVRHHG